MKKLKNYLFSQPLIGGSFIMMTGTFLANVGNYLFHLFMGRLLGPAQYGILGSLISVLYLLSIPLGTLALVIVKFVSFYKGQKNKAAISSLFFVFSREILLWGGIFSLFLLAFSQFLVNFLHLPTKIFVFLLIFIFFISLFSTLNTGILQGLLRFSFLVSSSLLGVFLKLSLALLFVFLGLQVEGVLWAMVISGILAYLFTCWGLKDLFKDHLAKVKINGGEMASFAWPVFLATLSMTSLYTIDIILVRHFFESYQAGLYAALSVLGKIIFFATLPVIAVMFPLISEAYGSRKKFRHFLASALLLVGGVSLLIVGIYFLLPGLMIKILFGAKYLGLVVYLPWFGIFLALYSLANVFVNFYLSIGKTKTVIFPVLAAISQISLIWFFHASFWQIIVISLSISSLLLLALMLYYPYVRTQA